MSCALTRALQTSAGSPCTPFQAYPAKLGTCWTSAKPWSVPIPAASPRGALLCKTLSSLSDPEPVPGCVVPPSDPDPTPSVPTPSNPSKGQRGPIGTSNSDTSSHQEPLLGLKKRSNGPVAVAISGGVDSAVAAMLLKDAGYELFGIFMRNWDESEETGNQNCSVEEDHRDAKRVCSHLGIPLYEADFVDQYWNKVFSHFVAQYSKGLTPNPDLECNRSIKFGALLRHAQSLGADRVATGHYARVVPDMHGGGVQLLKGVDPNKDQSYFLASVPATALQHFMFPLGGMLKPDVRALAARGGLASATRRSSAGVCFIGRRKFAQFIGGYVEPMRAQFVGVDTGRILGECSNLAAVTWGQGAAIGGHPYRCFVVGKDVPERLVYVTDGKAGPDHPALLSHTALLHSPQWVAGEAPERLLSGLPLPCSFKARYRQTDGACEIGLASSTTRQARQAGLGSFSADDYHPSRFTQLLQDDTIDKQSLLHVRFEEPLKAVTPEQAFVMYDGEICLGSALVQHSGPTLFETRHGTCE
ncbi:hypothetical protein ABBQ32_001565 [Trebouxia sp. C0010 RCD-2024]